MQTRKNSNLLLLALLSFLVFVPLQANAEQQTLPPLPRPFKAPAFELKGEDGKTYRLSDYHGKVVIVMFWATWCPPCRYEMPSLERAWQKVKDEGIVVLGVNVGEDADTIFAFTGTYPVSFPLPMDREGKIIKQYKVIGLPTGYVVSPDGMVTHRAIGSREWDDEKILAQLRAMRKQ